jgi:hypothetical protein
LGKRPDWQAAVTKATMAIEAMSAAQLRCTSAGLSGAPLNGSVRLGEIDEVAVARWRQLFAVSGGRRLLGKRIAVNVRRDSHGFI